MKPRDIALAVVVAAAWGFNFVVIDVGLEQFPPLLFSALRFLLAAFPAVLFVRRPRRAVGPSGEARPVPWRWIFAVALSLGVIKFWLLFSGMDQGMPAGLSSLVLQCQAIFTLLLAVLLLGERPGRRQLAGVGLAVAGLALVAWQLGPQRPADAFALLIAAAAAWGVSNVAMRKAAPADMLAFMVWVSAFSAPPLIALSLIFDGPAAVGAALRGIDLTAVAALLFIAGVSTLAGFGAWGALIRRYGASTVAPFSMLVPFFGIASAAVFLGEAIRLTDVIGGAMVVGGLLVGAVRARAAAGPAPAGPAPAEPATAAVPAATLAS